MVLVGLILLSGMSVAGIRIWLQRKNESKQESFVNTKQNIEHNKDL